MSGYSLLVTWSKGDTRYFNEFKEEFWLHENTKWLLIRIYIVGQGIRIYHAYSGIFSFILLDMQGVNYV